MEGVLLNLIVLCGIVLSFFFAFLMLTSKPFRSEAHNYLAITIISLSMTLVYTWFEAYVPANGVLEIVSWDFLFPFAFLMYVLKAIAHPISRSNKIWLLGIPCLLLSVLQGASFIADFDPFEWLAGGDEDKMLRLIDLRTFSAIPFSIALVGFAYWKVSATESHHRKWLKVNCLVALVFLWCWLLNDFIAYLLGVDIWSYFLVLLAIVLMIITYKGIHVLNIVEQRKQIGDLQFAGHLAPVQEEVSQENVPAKQKSKEVSTSRKTEEKIDKLNALMMERRLYLLPDLTRTIVAEKLGISEGYLSELIKTSLDSNFNDYINEFRVKHAILMFRDPQFSIFSIEAIGFESGFKSKSVFYNAFKKVVEKTPGAYRKALDLS